MAAASQHVQYGDPNVCNIIFDNFIKIKSLNFCHANFAHLSLQICQKYHAFIKYNFNFLF